MDLFELFILLSFCVINSLKAKFSTGIISTKENWIYLERFCFVSEAGLLSYTFQYPKKYEIESIYLYFDTNDQWPSAYDKNKNCKQKEKVLNPDNKQVIYLSPLAKHPQEQAECSSFKQDNEEWYNCHGNRSFDSRRPRWWYLALVNCDSTIGLYLEYSLWMTNAEPSNRWFHHFSFDEFYILPINTIFMVIEIMLLAVAIVFTCLLRSRNMFHNTFKLFLNSLILDLTGLISMWIHYDRYSDNGQGYPMMRTFGLLLRQFSNVLFVLLLLLIAKGYTITRGKLSAVSNVKLLVFITTFLVCHVIMLVWEISFDPAEVVYMSESGAAYVIAVLRIIAWLWYLYSAYKTIKKYPLKKFFYVTLGFFMTFWFWSGPVALVISNFVLDNWVRAEVMLGAESGVTIFGFITFLVLTAPLPDNHNFPYHTRVNQILQDDYPQHVYEVRYTATQMPNGNGVEIREAGGNQPS